jgi:phytanoyl-CoA hydroxylase
MAASAQRPHPWQEVPAYELTVEDYKHFRAEGYLVVRGLVLPEHIEELKRFCDDILHGRIELEGIEPPSPGATQKELETRLLRVHMLHCQTELAERYLLYPRVLDVVQALQGPDVLALQTMLFFKGPGALGQGYHQDSFYIPTFPDSLIGAWIAIDRADTENGCLWMSPGSQNEPIYPPANGYGYGDFKLKEIEKVSNVGGHCNDDDDLQNTLRPIAERYKSVEVPCILEPGDVAFFGGHVFHRSLSNKTPDRMRRAFVNHYCNARSFTPWLDGNASHILARGNTTLGFAKPRFETPCAALNPQTSISDRGSVPDMMMGMPDGRMRPGKPKNEPDLD